MYSGHSFTSLPILSQLPPLEFVRAVADAANAYWAEHPDDYIAIHCAYGE